MKKKRKIKKKVEKKIKTLILIIGILLIIGVLYFLFIEGLIASDEITDRQVKKELIRISELNQNLDYDKINISEPWIIFGTYQGNYLVRGYSCSDVCPENGGYKLIYGDVGSEEKCDEFGGKTLYDYSWGEQFAGCEPVVD